MTSATADVVAPAPSATAGTGAGVGATVSKPKVVRKVVKKVSSAKKGDPQGSSVQTFTGLKTQLPDE